MFRISIITLILLLSFSATAFENGSFYLKGIIGISKLNQSQEKKQAMNFIATQDSILSPSIGAGIGFNVNQNIRAEIIAHSYSPTFETSTTSVSYSNNNSHVIGSLLVKRKAIIQTLMYNNYITILHRDNYNIFIGGGIGVAKIKENVSLCTSSNVIQNNRMFAFPPSIVSSSTKKVSNFTFALSIGSTFKLQNNINLEVIYNWRDFGKTKPISDSSEEKPTKNRYKGHDFTVGLRLDI